MTITKLLAVIGLALAVTAHAQENPLGQSVSSGVAVPTTLQLSLRDATERAIKYNLATVYSSEAERIAAAQRLGDLAQLLPRLDSRLSTEQRQVNLAAFGFGGFPGVKQVIGPFALLDARAQLTTPLIDLERRHNLRESESKELATALSSANVREAVVLTAVDLYFQVISANSRVAAVEAQVSRAATLHQRATDLKNAGFVPGIDVVRAEVEQRSLEQRLIQAKNAVEKQKLLLARAIGLPLSQGFVLTDKLPPESQLDLPMASLLDRAYANRPDVKALDAQIRAAEEAIKAVKARRMPALNAQGDYGVNGRTPGNLHGTYSLRLEVKVPIFDRSIESDELEKESDLRRKKAEQDNLRSRIEFEVRSSLIDMQSTLDQLQVARRSVELARQQLDQAQDRFGAGVADNLEVVQAQEAVALADEGVIQSLYSFNISRALLAKATGSAERAIQEVFPGNSSK